MSKQKLSQLLSIPIVRTKVRNWPNTKTKDLLYIMPWLGNIVHGEWVFASVNLNFWQRV